MESFTCDVLVVGGGIAGLTTAAYLSKAGINVLLCEKEKHTGGLINSYPYQGFTFDGGIRAMEDSGIVRPMLRQLGIEVDFLPNPVSIGIGKDVVRIHTKDDLAAYQALLEKHFPADKPEIAAIIQELARVMQLMDVLYGIDNPLFLDLMHDPQLVFKTILPWAVKYLSTLPKMAKYDGPVYAYLSKFTRNQALLDIIAQHFFQQTPAFFALSYFSLYLDYRYPRGGTGAMPQALEQFILSHGGKIRRETTITAVDPARSQALDANGVSYHYRKLVWAADLKTLYRVVDLSALTDQKVVRKIQARQNAVSDKLGGDSVFTLNLTVNLDPAYFGTITSPHFFYTPSTTGLAHASLDELRTPTGSSPAGFTADKARLLEWLQRFLDLTTYEISVPVLRDSTLAPAGQTGLIVSTLFDYALTRHIQSLGWYDEFRQVMTDHMLAVLDRSIYPGLTAAVSGSFTSTPLTIEKISGNAEGAITGWAFTNPFVPAVSQLLKVSTSVLTPIPNTYQAGQWTYSPSGMPISILTGKLAADQVLKALG